MANAVTFDATFYLTQNPDVRAAIATGAFQGTAEQHFEQFGKFEGRDPNQFFDTEFYLEQNPDVAAGIVNGTVTSAFDHFQDFGVNEGLVRRPSAEFFNFTPDDYLAQNPDLQAAFADVPADQLNTVLFRHFLTFGINEDRPGSGVDFSTPGSNFFLTSGADNITGTVNNDTFFGSSATINAGDRLDGGDGVDTLNVSGIGTIASPTLTNIERVDFDGAGAGTITADFSGSSSVQRVAFVDQAGTTNNVTVASGVTVRFDDVSGSTANVTYKSGTTSSLEVANGSAVGAIVLASAAANTITTVSVASSGLGANSIDSIAAGTAFTTLNISGSQDLTIDTLTGVTTVNGSAASGDLDLTLDATKDVTVTGGSGDDRFDFGAGLTTADVVNGGAGANVVAVAGGDYSATGGNFAGLTNIQTVEFTGAGTTLNGANFTNASITNLLFNTTGADIVNAAGSARTYEFGEDNAGAATFNMKAGATTVNIELDGTASTGAGADVTALTVNLNAADLASKATINIVSLEATGDTTANTITSITAITGSTINVSGAADTSIGSLANAATVNGSGVTGLFTIGGSDGADIITVGSGGSFVNAGAGADQITLGAGIDTVIVGTGDSGTINTAGALVGFDVITGFTAGIGGDVLDAEGVAGTFQALTTAQLNTVAGAADLLAATDAAILAAGDTALEWTAFSFGGQTYAVFNAATGGTDFDATTDFIVQLNGVLVTDLDPAGANFA